MSCNLTPFVKDPGKDFMRQRKLSFVQMIRFCIYMESGCIGHELPKYFFFNPVEMPTAFAFIQQRDKLLPEAFCQLFKQFTLRFPPCKREVEKGFNAIHTISLFDLVSKRYLDVVVQPGRQKMNLLPCASLWTMGGCHSDKNERQKEKAVSGIGIHLLLHMQSSPL